MAAQTSEELIKPTQELPKTTSSPEKFHPFKKLSERLVSLNPFPKRISNQELREFEDRGKTFLQEQEKIDGIREKLTTWSASMKPQLDERARSFGLDLQEIPPFVDRMLISFEQELSSIRKPEELIKLKEKAKKNATYLPSDPDAISYMQQQIDSMTSVSLLDLISRKLDGNITEIEKLKLKLLIAKEGKVELGKHSLLDNGDLGISILGPQNLKRYEYTLQHEFTHFALDTRVPKARGIRMLKLTLGQVNSSGPTALFYQMTSAIDESFAYTTENILGGNMKPHFESYKQKIPPRIFESIYDLVMRISEGKTLEEFDKISVQLYGNFVSHLKEDLTQQDINSAVSAFVSDATARITS